MRGLASGGMNTSSGRSQARAITAAASAALPQLAMASGRRGLGVSPIVTPEAGARLDLAEDGEPHEVPPLVGAGDVVGLVLDPDAAEPASRAPWTGPSLRAKGVTTKPRPSTRATAASSSRTIATNASSPIPRESASACAWVRAR